ncbi:MAG: hypothetical protein F6K52_14495, partial [Moorea sp. SIO3H5]|nr:hypothetical protein [Moorena sp. SIO3H5]
TRGKRQEARGKRQEGKQFCVPEVRPVANLILNGKSAPQRESTSKNTVPHES